MENAIEYAFVKARGGQIRPEHLPPELTQPREALPQEPSGGSPMPGDGHGVPHGADRRDVLEQTLAATDWNVAKAARRLDVSRTTVYEQIKCFALVRPAD